MSTLNDFISQIKNTGLSRTSRYAVSMRVPSKLQTGTFDVNNILLFCDQVQLPAINLATSQNKTFGEIREVPYEKNYENINMSFYVDTGLEVKSLFDSWMDLIQNPTTRTFEYYKYYTTEIKVEVQDLEMNSRYWLSLYECYPKNISAVSLDYSSKDVMKLQVNMQYKYWKASNRGPINESLVDMSIPDEYMNNFGGYQTMFNSYLAEAQNFETAVTSFANDPLRTVVNKSGFGAFI